MLQTPRAVLFFQAAAKVKSRELGEREERKGEVDRSPAHLRYRLSEALAIVSLLFPLDRRADPFDPLPPGRLHGKGGERRHGSTVTICYTPRAVADNAGQRTSESRSLRLRVR